MYDRREFVCSLAAAAVGGVAFGAKAEQKPSTRLILLGTKGGPRLSTAARNCSVLLVIRGVPYVVDCGYGTSQQLLAAGVPVESVRYLFITHHHSDHNLDYGPLLYNSWVTGRGGRIDAYGPPGLVKMTKEFFDYVKLDLDIRIPDEGRPDPRASVFPHEVSGPGVVMKNADVTVTAARVSHPPIVHAYAYRFDTPDGSIVISGDTAYSPALAELAKGADVLVHEVMYKPALEALLARVPNATRLREHLLASHTLTEDVGKVAALAGVKKLVLYHFVPPDDPSATDEDWAAGVRRHYAGPIVVGKDLLEVPLR